MIVYSVSAGSVSIASLFLAGVLPGILVGICLIVAALIAIRRMDVKPEAAASLSDVLVALRRSVLSLALIVVVLGGILSGLMTATEAAAIAAAYSLFLTVVVYREVTLRMLPEIFRSSAQTTAVVLCLVAACSALSWILTTVNIPHAVSDALLGISSQPLVVLLIINLILILVGTFMDMTPAVLIFTPIFLPVVTGLGINEIHFGIIMIANLCIGLCTPPVGSCLFIGCGVGKASIADVSRAMIPFFAAMIVSLVIISLWPALSLWLPALVRP
jgi:tripartite ATP-independent transporter DctM subunit